MTTAIRDGLAAFASFVTPRTRNTPELVRKALTERFGDLIDRLERHGLLTITTLEDYNARARDERKIEGLANAVCIGGRQIFMFADCIAVGDEAPVLMHELGGHASLERMLGPKRFSELARRVKDLATQGDETAERALLRIPEDTGDEAFESELIGYLLEEAVASRDRGEGISVAVELWLREVVAAIRAWFFTTAMAAVLASYGFQLELSVHDVVALGCAAVRWRTQFLH